MSSEGVSYLIAELKLALAPVGKGLCLVSRLDRQPEGWESDIQRLRAAIVEELQRRVVPLQPRTAPAPGVDPWRHSIPGLERMAEARDLLHEWHMKRFPVRVTEGAPITAADTFNAETLQAPSYLKMELLWLLKDEAPLPTRHSAVPGRVYDRTSGGAA